MIEIGFEINTSEQYQYPILPTGCEVTATSILLNSLYFDHECKLDLTKITKESLAELVDKEQDPDIMTKLVGNPYRSFIGSPYSKDSFGCFHNVVKKLLEFVIYQNKENYSKFQVVDFTKYSVNTSDNGNYNNDDDDGEVINNNNNNKNPNQEKYLLKVNESKEYIQSRLDYFNLNQVDDDSDFQILIDHMVKYNTPIIVWMTLELREPRITDEWFDIKNPSLPLFWVSPEHCATLSGFTDTHVIITDPHTGRKEKYNKHLFLKRWRQLGRQAVSVIIN